MPKLVEFKIFSDNKYLIEEKVNDYLNELGRIDDEDSIHIESFTSGTNSITVSVTLETYVE